MLLIPDPELGAKFRKIVCGKARNAVNVSISDLREEKKKTGLESY